MKKKILYVIGAIFLLLIITNPSQKAFKEYLGRTGYGGLKRPYNFFVCSEYKSSSGNYFAIAGNFFKIPVPQSTLQSKADSTRKADSALMADSAKMATDTSKIDISRYQAKELPLPPLPKGWVAVKNAPKKKWTPPDDAVAVDQYGNPIHHHKHHRKSDPLGLQRSYDSAQVTKN